MNKEDIIRMYEKANGWSPEGWDKTVDELERFANLVAAAEREACAKIGEFYVTASNTKNEPGIALIIKDYIRNIRARGQG